MRIKPPHVALLGLALAGALHLWVPASRVFHDPLDPWGWPIIGAGVGFIASALMAFKDHDTTHDPHAMPTAMVTDGIFAYTRNPMYLGVTFILAGAALNIGTLPFYLLPVAFFLTMQFVFIPREERRLAHLFGQDYAAYRARIPRWF